MFNSKYPIIALGMNQVSNLELALAVANAGAVPTITAFNYANKDYVLDIENLINDFSSYRNKINSCNFIFSIDDKLILKNQSLLLPSILNFKIDYVEIILNIDILKNNHTELTSFFNILKRNNIKLLTKLISIENLSKKLTNYINNTFQGIIVKGPDGAGRVDNNSNKKLKDILIQCFELFPNKSIIPCGGIGSSTDVKELIDLGAAAVGIGTLFAAAKESPLSLESKEKIINANSKDLKKLQTHDFDQQALVFSNVEQSKINNTQGLIEGIKTGNTGHIFLGKSIDCIDRIKTVNEIILELST